MDKVITLNGKELGLRATALTPRLYRHKFGRDLIVDLNKLKDGYEKAQKQTDSEESPFSVVDLTIFENVAFIMARQYDKNIPSIIEDWLDSLDAAFTIYEILPAIIELWQLNEMTTARPQKK